MGLFSEMFSPRKDPSVELDKAPHQIRPVLQTTANDWGPAPTGYLPNFNADRQGEVLEYPDWNPFNSVYNPNGSTGGRPLPVDAVNAIRTDQHPFMQVSGTWTPITHEQGNGRPTGRHDPQTDGPGQPELRLLSTWYYRASGTSRTSYMDVPDGRVFPRTGSQDGASTTWYQSAGAAMAPYSVDPANYSAKFPNSSTEMPDSLSAIPSGPSHGWSAIPVAPGTSTTRVQTASRRQQQYVSQNRLAMSTYAGQTFSQSTAHVQNPPGTGVNAATPMSSTPGGIA